MTSANTSFHCEKVLLEVKTVDVFFPKLHIAHSFLSVTSYVHPAFSSHFRLLSRTFFVLSGVYLFFFLSAINLHFFFGVFLHFIIGANKRYCNARDSKGLKDSQVASITNIGKSTFSDWKSGRSNPKNDKLQKIADVLNVSIEWLTTGEERKGNSIYYTNDETARLAQEMYEDEDMRSLFDMKRNMPPERFQAHMDFMKNLYNQEKGTDL